MDKYGIKMYTIKSGRNKDSLSPFRAPREDELAYWQDMTDEFVGQFTNVVEQSRGDKIKGNREDIFDGRVFSGKKALEIGLIDSIGTLHDAVKDAAEMGGIEDEEPYIIKKPKEKNDVLNLFFSKVLLVGVLWPAAWLVRPGFRSGRIPYWSASGRFPWRCPSGLPVDAGPFYRSVSVRFTGRCRVPRSRARLRWR